MNSFTLSYDSTFGKCTNMSYAMCKLNITSVYSACIYVCLSFVDHELMNEDIGLILWSKADHNKHYFYSFSLGWLNYFPQCYVGSLCMSGSRVFEAKRKLVTSYIMVIIQTLTNFALKPIYKFPLPFHVLQKLSSCS